MRFAPGLLAVAVIVASAAPLLAECGDGPGDAADMAATRADIAATCSCATATSHGEYVRCAHGVIRAHVAGNMLGSECVKPLRLCRAVDLRAAERRHLLSGRCASATLRDQARRLALYGGALRRRARELLRRVRRERLPPAAHDHHQHDPALRRRSVLV